MSFPITITQTFPENWPRALVELAAPMVSLTLSPEDALALGTFSTVFRRQMEVSAQDFLSDTLLAEIDAALEKFPEGVMPRIGYCSWKASQVETFPARTRTDVLRILTTDDPRIGNALSVQVSCGDPVVLHLRAWRDMPDLSEMRLFFKGGTYVGASQYAYRHRFAQIVRNAARIEDLLTRAAAELQHILHLPDVIVDLSLPSFEDMEGEAAGPPLLVELNPFGRLSDACLFTWDRGGNFDGSFRYRS